MGPGKKKSKSYYRKSGANYRKQDRMLQAGMKGILITCSGNESKCVREAYNLLNEYADQLYGPEKTADDPDIADGEDESDEDISDLLEKELSTLKEQHSSKVKRFRSVRTGAKNVIFIQTNDVDPHSLIQHILNDLEKTKTQKSRNIQRMLPVSHTCKAFNEKIEKTAQEMIYPVFLASDVPDSTFCIMFKARNNNTIKKDAIVQLLAPIVTQGSTHIHKVDFDAPQHTIMVDVLGGVCCLSILKDYNRFKKYNLHLVAGSNDGGVALGEGKRKRTDGVEEEGEDDAKKRKVDETEKENGNQSSDSTMVSEKRTEGVEEEADAEKLRVGAKEELSGPTIQNDDAVMVSEEMEMTDRIEEESNNLTRTDGIENEEEKEAENKK